MSINEIWVPGALAALFLGIPILRPFVERLRALDGLALLPLVALGILVGIFPAYGFRLEVVPMLVFAVLRNLAGLFSLVASKLSRVNDPTQEISPFRTAFALVLLVTATIPLFAFSPRINTRLERETEPPAHVVVPWGFSGRERVLRVYGPVLADRPLVFMIPSEIGGAVSVELVSEAMRDNGFTVVTYSCQEHDAIFVDRDGRRRLSLSRLLAHWRVSRRATDLASVNERGRSIEAARRADVEFLLPRLPELLGLARDDMPPVLFVGHGAGGSALAGMAGEGGFLARHSDALGVVAVESHLWSSFQNEPREPVPLTDGSAFERLRISLGNWLDDRRVQRVTRAAPLPEAGLPVLYLVSGRALDAGAQREYQAVFDALRTGGGSVALAAIESAGPLDYQDHPFTQPMLSFFMRGLRGAGRSENPIGDTAGVIGNFASSLLERRQAEWDELAAGVAQGYEDDAAETEGDAEEARLGLSAPREIAIPPRAAVTGALRVEGAGLPWLRLQ